MTDTPAPAPRPDRENESRDRTAYILSFAIVVLTVVVLQQLGRFWWCVCGEPFLWSGDVWSEHNSQHLADPYSFTHLAHGLIFAVLFRYLPPFRGWSFAWRFVLGLTVECAWEVVENTPLVINRYRETTMALGYTGDTIGNSLGDIACFILGFVIASRIAWYWSAAIFLAMEAALLVMIRDNLLLNVLMLLWPIDAIKHWQTGG